MKKLLGLTLILLVALAAGLTSCKSSQSNIPVGVYELPADENFDVDAAPGHLVIIDFNATWCGPCRQFTPVFEQASRTFEGKVQFVSVDVDKHPELAAKLQISSIPAILFINTDGQKDWHIGLMTQAQFDQAINDALK